MSVPVLLFDLAGRGSIVLTGKDRATFLHGLVTNDVKKLTPGQGCAAAFLTAKGKLLAECVVLCEEDRLVLDTPPELSSTVERLLRTYLVFNDVTIANETDETYVLHLADDATGSAVEDILRRVIGHGEASTLPREPHASVAARFTFREHPSSPGAAAGGAIRVVVENRIGVPGWDLRCPSSHSEEIRRAFQSAGAQLEAHERLESLRIAAGIPRWGAELTEAVLPDEAGLRERGFVAENKGCYVGQEIVARIKTYGHVNRRLVLLGVSGNPPAPGDAVLFQGERIGALTSVASSLGGAVALAFVKRERAEPGTSLSISSASGVLPATVSSAPLV